MHWLQGVPPDSIRQVVRRTLAGREYDWTLTRNPLDFVKPYLERWLNWLAELRTLHPAAYTALMLASAVILAAILMHFGYLVWRAVRRAEGAPAVSRAARPVARDATWYLGECERLRADGRYAEALAHRFVAMVLWLQQAGAVTVRPWKTPAEYAREAALDAAGQEELGVLVGMLYRHRFGGEPCTRLEVDDFDRRAQSLGAHLAPR